MNNHTVERAELSIQDGSTQSGCFESESGDVTWAHQSHDTQSRGGLTARQFGGGEKAGPMSRYRHEEAREKDIEETRR